MSDRRPSTVELERLFPALMHRLTRAVAALEPGCARSAAPAELERRLRRAARWAGDRDWSRRLESLCWEVETDAARRGCTGVNRRPAGPPPNYLHPLTRDPLRPQRRR